MGIRINGFCVRHAYLGDGLLENGKIPRWMKQFPLPDQLLYKGDQYNTWDRANVERPPLKGLVDLCPCDDGTLVAALYKRRVEKVSASRNYSTARDTEYKPVFHDDNALYTAVYHTDLKNGAIAVDWTEIGGTNLAVRVQKQPVFCWSLIESLTAMLDVLAPAL